MTEASLSDPEHHDGFYSVLGEASLFQGPHNPYGRLEYATRPEYPRDGAQGSDGFFRYDHDADPLEWNNLADSPGYAEAKNELAKHLPKKNVPEVPGNGPRRSVTVTSSMSTPASCPSISKRLPP